MYTHSPRIVTDGLYSVLDAGINKSYPKAGSTWYDLISDARNGTLIDSPSFSEEMGGALNFDGTNYVDWFASNLINPPFTVETWIKPSEINQTNQGLYRIFTRRGSGTVGGIVVDNSQLRLLNNGGNFYGSTAITNNTWYYAVGVWIPNNWKFYVNGQEKGSGAVTLNAANTSLIRIGRDYEQRYFKGLIATIRIYNRELSNEEIQSNFNALRGRFGL